MGWSIDVVRTELNKVFKEAATRYRITRPQSSQQGVVIEYLIGNEDLPMRFKRRITELFPDFVYVEFNPVQATQQVADQMEWDN